MEYPKKLIAVGMRYIKGVGHLIQIGASVTLVYTKNEHGTNGMCWEVQVDGTKIGYIREVDVPLLKGFSTTRFPVMLQGYKIKLVNTNYLVLNAEYTAKVDYSTGKVTSPWTNPQVDATTILQSKISDNQIDKLNKQGQPKMNTNSMRDSFFREVKNAVLDMTTGGFGISTPEGIAVYKDGTVTINPIVEMGVKVPAFAMRVSVDTLEEGDIIITGTETNFFKAVTEAGYEVVSLSGEVKQVGNVANMFFGKNTVLAIKNMVAGTGMNPMMMAMLFAGDEAGSKMDMKTLAMMSMMGGKSGMDTNMLMMMMLMGK